MIRKVSYVMRDKNYSPTDSELEILQVLWEMKEARVKEVHEKLSQHKDVGYTTVLKLMQIMHEKGLLSRELSGKSHIYRPGIKKEQVQEKFLDKVMQSVYKGSAFKLVMNALGNYKTSPDELEQIKKFIQSKEKEDNHE
uniref:BlaI/MecI/CopY family transcriptional regulator n=1 Tax=Roseihalotalea indica TaxID=2867963 RepID=A0AA49GJT6_9BACT|nr:BlaI/MecI/CopY family transcriptional regulator [Tunicatimonas sp. TK19036]